MKRIIELTGNQIINPSNTDYEEILVELDRVIKISTKRSGGLNENLYCNDDDVVVLEYNDGVEWITRVDELDSIFLEEKKNRSGDNSYILKTKLIETKKRGGEIGLNLIKLFKKKAKKKITEKVILQLGLNLDKFKNKEPGLKVVKHNFQLTEFDASSAIKTKPYLLLIHGFFSSIEQSFEDLKREDNKVLWTKLRQKYNGRILAFDHYTISQSPLENTKLLLDQLPNEITLDVFSFSRGGLVADLLSLISELGKNSKKRIANETKKYIKKKKERTLLDALIKRTKTQKITVRKTTRVACPANGTQLLSRRLNIFLNGVLESLGFAFGKVNPIYNTFKSFTKDVIHAKTNVDIFPGIAAMVPDSDFLNFTNNCKIRPSDNLIVVSGDSEVGRNFFRSLAVILSNLIHWEGNDLVVNTRSMHYGLKRENGVHTIKWEAHEITHFKYLVFPKSRSSIYYALQWDGITELKGFNYFTYEQLEDQLQNGGVLTRGLKTEDSPISSDNDLLTDFFSESANQNYKTKLDVELYHTDLKYAKYPVMVGHFKGEAIISAERALDKQLGYRLTERNQTGLYPRDKDDTLILLTTDNDHRGGIVIGLGDISDFTEAELRIAVRNGVLKYAIELRDIYSFLKDDFPRNAISPLFVGSTHGELSILDSINAILFGIAEANENILEINNQNIYENENKLVPITKLQFIDYYEHIVREAFHKFNELKKNNIILNFDTPPSIVKGLGQQKGNQYYSDKSHWQSIHTEIKVDENNPSLSKIEHKFNAGKAKISDTTDYFSKELIEKLILNLSSKSTDYYKIPELLYNLLIPKRIKNEISNRPNICWKMNAESAEYPWEMLQDSDTNHEPIFIKSGIVRQLFSEANYPYEKIAREKKALIIGDPIYDYEDLKPLKGAYDEAHWIENRMKLEEGWQLESIYNGGLYEIVNALYKKNKMLHIAGHGVYEEHKNRGGIVVENIILDSQFFKTLPYIPEFVFINCCNSGTYTAEFEKTYKKRYKISASIGIQLIELGVQAVIITGWPVDDDAAKDFAEIFYEEFLAGQFFGNAVKDARRYIYDKYKHSLTWGAYQCYGNPHYKIKRKKTIPVNEEYSNEDQFLVDLFNVKSKCVNKEEIEDIETLLEGYISKGQKWMTPKVLEAISLIYFELNKLKKAEEYFVRMISKNNADYSVESLEQYFSLLMKKETSKVINAFDKRATKKQINELLKNFESLVKLKENQVRLSLKASAYKHMFLIHKEDLNYSYIEEMVKYYERASKANGNNKLHSLLNYYQGKYFLELKRMISLEENISNLQKRKKSKYRDENYKILNKEKINKQKLINEEISHTLRLLGKYKEENKDAHYRNFKEATGLVKILTTLLIYKKETRNIAEEIKEIYIPRFKKAGTYKNLQAEIEHFKFLQILIESMMMNKNINANYNLDRKLKAVNDILISLNNISKN